MKESENTNGPNLFLGLRFILINSVIWSVIFGLTLSESVFFYQVNEKPIPWARILLNDSFFVFWLLFTPFIFLLLRHWHQYMLRWRSFYFKVFLLGLIFIPFLIGLEAWVRYYYGLNASAAQGYFALLIQLVTFRFHTFFILYLSVIGVSVASMEYYKSKKLEKNQEELNQQLIEAQLDNLKNQIRPHFLFNSLHTISALILKKENQLAIEMIAKLSDLLRLSLKLDNRPWIALREEMDLVRRYLDIHAVRFGDELNYNIDADANVLDSYVPSLLLQPIIENSLIHGIIPNNNKGHISISARIDEGNVKIIVENDLSLDPDIDDLKEGVGLTNTIKRLNSLYSSGYQMEYGRNEVGDKFQTKLIIPIRNKE